MNLVEDPSVSMNVTFRKKCLRYLDSRKKKLKTNSASCWKPLNMELRLMVELRWDLDRLVMLLAGRTNLRDTIAFPKTASASCLLTEAPGGVSDAQLKELSLSLDVE